MSFFTRLVRSTSQSLSDRTLRTTMDSPNRTQHADGEDVRMLDAHAAAGTSAGVTNNAPEIQPVNDVNTQIPVTTPFLSDQRHAPVGSVSGDVLAQTLLQVLETQRQQAEYFRTMMEKRDEGSVDFVSKKADKVLWAALDKVRRFDGVGNRTFDMFLSDFMNAAEMAELAPEKYLKVMHSMVVGEALTYARTAVVPAMDKGGLDSLTMDEYVEKMREGRFGDSLNPIQRTGRILCKVQHDKPLDEYLKDVERELNLLPHDTPGWVKVSLALWGMRATVACQVQSNPRDPSGMFHDFISFRNHALSTVQMSSKSEGKQPVWKRQAPTTSTPPARIYRPNGSIDWGNVKCKHCGQYGHGSAANPSCPKHDPTWIRRGLNQPMTQKSQKKT